MVFVRPQVCLLRRTDPPRNRSSNGQSRHGDTHLPFFPRSQSDVFGPGTPNQSPRITRHNTIPSKQLEHILPGN